MKTLITAVSDATQGFIYLGKSISALHQVARPLFEFVGKMERLKRQRHILKYNMFWFGVTSIESKRLEEVELELFGLSIWTIITDTRWKHLRR
jgi:hypothetical protein